MNNIIESPKITKTTTVNQINIGQFLKGKESQLKAALPKHLTVERLTRIAVTELRKIPKLRECTVESLFSAIIQCAQLGLEPGSALGHAYLIPYGRECQFIIGYRGMIDLARRSGEIQSIFSEVVYSNDEFRFEFGLDEKLKHIPARGERGEFVAAYMVAKFKDGGHLIQVMFKNEIDKIRKRSKAANNGPWVTDYDEMAKKTIIRRGFKYLPISIEVARLIEQDDKAGIEEQDNFFVFDGEYEAKEEQKPANKADRIADKLANDQQEQPTSSEEPRDAEEVAREFFGEEETN
jgi:recombination protein RecT